MKVIQTNYLYVTLLLSLSSSSSIRRFGKGIGHCLLMIWINTIVVTIIIIILSVIT